jgi:hypothetical protein
MPAYPRRPLSYDATTLGVGATVVGLAFLLYLLTAGRDIVVGDTPELITAAVTLGVPHPPGYPLFTMLGHLFSLLPLGPIPFRVNLLAATCDALTVGIVYLIALRLGGYRLAAAIAALMLAVSPIFWTWSLVSEVFPLNNLLASLLIYLLVTWHEQPERTGVLAAAFFVGGLALTNHQTIVLLVPAFCFVLWQGRAVLRARPQIFAVCIAAFFMGLLPYAYVPWAAARHPAYNWGGVSSLKDLFALITRQSYGARHLVSSTGYTGGSPVDRVLALCVSFGPLLGSVTLLGLIYAYRRQRWYFWFSILAFAGIGPFFVSITNLNLATAPFALYVLERFFILPHVVLAPLLALGVLMIAEFIASHGPALPIQPLRLVAGVGLIAVLAILLTNYRGIDQSHNHIARSFGEDVFATVEPGAILLASGDAIVLPLTYLRTVEGLRQDVTLVLLPLLPGDWYLRQLRERHPDLTIPFNHYDGGSNSLKMLIEANKGRTIVSVGNVPKNDKSLAGSYRFYPHGLVNVIEPKSRDVSLQEIVSDNEQLLNRYRLPSPRGIKVKSFESEILSLYAQPALRIGNEYERVNLRQEARTWYQRAIALDPDLPQARAALARVGR